MKEGIIWVFIGLGICLLSWRINIGSFKEPGPGFVAFIAGLIILITGSFIFLSKIILKFNNERKIPKLKERWNHLVYNFLLLVFYSIMIQKLGYILTTFLTMFGLFYNLGNNKIVTSILGSILCVAITYILFDIWLKVQLPRGILPWW